MNVLDFIHKSHLNGVPYMTLETVHKYDCPTTHRGSRHGQCNCGGDQLQHEVETALGHVEMPEEMTRHIEPTEPTEKKGYLAYVLTEKCRARLLKAYPPKFLDVLAHHVTVEFDVPFKFMERAAIRLIEHIVDDSLEGFIVEVNGSKIRPDGGIYHITWSLDRKKGRKPVDTNDLARELRGLGNPKLPDVMVQTEPKFIPL